MFIPVILGTARLGRESEKVANFILDEVRKAGFQTELLDVRSYRIDATDKTLHTPQGRLLAPIIEKADALIIVSPEYNHGYPGELKMMLDMLTTQYAGKPVGLCGVSSGPFGGTRMVEVIKQVFIELHMPPIREALYFPMVKDLFDASGKIKDAAAYKDRLANFFTELNKYAMALKAARPSS